MNAVLKLKYQTEEKIQSGEIKWAGVNLAGCDTQLQMGHSIFNWESSRFCVPQLSESLTPARCDYNYMKSHLITVVTVEVRMHVKRDPGSTGASHIATFQHNTVTSVFLDHHDQEETTLPSSYNFYSLFLTLE